MYLGEERLYFAVDLIFSRIERYQLVILAQKRRNENSAEIQE